MLERRVFVVYKLQGEAHTTPPELAPATCLISPPSQQPTCECCTGRTKTQLRAGG